jgi:CheY-like chemotaxis protein
MADGPRILLVSPDLMAISRLAALARQAGGSLESLRSFDAGPREDGYDLVLIDLQGMAEDPALLVSRVRAAVPGRNQASPRVVAFGPHVATARLEQARAAGADEAVSRGELLGGFPAVLRRCCPGPANP